jgi:hypothetical protein
VRRLLAGGAAGLVLLLLSAPVTGAQEDAWAGSHSTTQSSSSSSTVVVTAHFVQANNQTLQRFEAWTWFTTPSGLGSGCDAAGERPLHTTHVRTSATIDTTSEAVTTACNGVYGYRVLARLHRGGVIRPSEKTITGEIRIAAPPPEVPKASASRAGSGATVSWSAVGAPPPDFLGYRVERRVGDGSWEPVAAELPASARSVDDASAPAGGDVTYRVRARRAGPDGQVLSSGQRAELTGEATTTPPGTDGTTTVPGADGSTTVPGGQAAGGGTKGTGGGSRVGALPSTIQPRGRTGIGTRAPRLGTPSQANFPPLLTPDDGTFEEEIDYGGGLAGEEEGDEELSSLFYEEDTGRGMAVPVATGFVLAAWAFHLRFLAKAARPVPVAAAAAVAGARGAGSTGFAADPFYEPLDEPTAAAPVAAGPAYQAPAHYRPPTLADRYDPFGDDRWR